MDFCHILLWQIKFITQFYGKHPEFRPCWSKTGSSAILLTDPDLSIFFIYTEAHNYQSHFVCEFHTNEMCWACIMLNRMYKDHHI